MRKRATVLMLTAVIGVAGCAATVSITPERIGSIRSVSVTPEVKLPPVASYHGPEGAWGAALGGIVGALIAQGAVKAPDQIKAYIAQENIDVGEIVRTQFMKGLQADSRFATKLGDGGDARFELEVFLYGLVSNGPFSGQFRPWLGIQAKLVEPSGKTIWQDRDHVFLDGAVPLAPYKAYFDDPATFRVGFAAAADAVTQMLLKKL